MNWVFIVGWIALAAGGVFYDWEKVKVPGLIFLTGILFGVLGQYIGIRF